MEVESITRSQAGALLERYRPRLIRMALLRIDPRLRRRVDPGDVVQDTFVEVTERLDDYLVRRPMPFYLWVRFLAVQKLNQLRQHHLGTARRDAGREMTSPVGKLANIDSLADFFSASTPGPMVIAARAEVLARVREALERLDHVDREVLALRYFEQLTLEESATLLGLSTSAVAKRQVTALGRLRRAAPRMEDVPTPP